MTKTLVAVVLWAGLWANPGMTGEMGNWKQVLAERIPLYGHRNWIVVADSAYPAQARAGIETIETNAGQIEVLETVLRELKATRHVRPIIYMDRELEFLHENEAPGVEAYRRQLFQLIPKNETSRLLHENVIAKLDEAGQTFRVLILKTTMTVPYTSVFLQLDCAYWTADQEKKLRAEMKASQ